MIKPCLIVLAEIAAFLASLLDAWKKWFIKH